MGGGGAGARQKLESRNSQATTVLLAVCWRARCILVGVPGRSTTSEVGCPRDFLKVKKSKF